MKVKIISKTVGVGELFGKGPQEIISYAARVSNPNNQMNFLTAPKLLKYCLNHGHVSIFEQASFTFEIQTTRAIAAQILIHKSFCFQEFSQRYAASDTYEEYEARSQDQKNRQNSVDNLSESDKMWWKEAQKEVWDKASGLYNEALSKGIAKECARSVLPLNTQTTLYMTGNVRSWIHYLSVRCDESTQKEHRDIANSIKAHLKAELPDIAEALEW